MDIRSKYTYGQKRKKKKKESLTTAIVSGLLPWKGDSAGDAIRKLVFLVSVVVLTVALILILNFYFGSHKDAEADYWNVDHSNTNTAMISMVCNSNLGSGEEVQVEILERYREYYEENPEFVGFLTIDPWIKYPVAQSKGDTPYDWYLNHNFYNVPTTNGTVFADKRGQINVPTAANNGRPANVMLHGHNLLTRNLFQPLVRYRESFEFLKEHPLITFDTLFEPGKYKIFSVYQTNILEEYGEYYNYLAKHHFNSKDDFYEYVTEALDRSRYHTDVDIRYGDELLTLSTCDFSFFSEIRLVVVARRVRDDESPYMDTESFVNLREDNGRTAEGFMKHKMWEAYYHAYNGSRGWAGRLWNTSRVEGVDEWLANRIESE